MKITKPFEFGGFLIRAALVEPREVAPANFHFSHYTKMLTEVWIEILRPLNPSATRVLDATIAREVTGRLQPAEMAAAR